MRGSHSRARAGRVLEDEHVWARTVTAGTPELRKQYDGQHRDIVQGIAWHDAAQARFRRDDELFLFVCPLGAHFCVLGRNFSV